MSLINDTLSLRRIYQIYLCMQGKKGSRENVTKKHSNHKSKNAIPHNVTKKHSSNLKFIIQYTLTFTLCIHKKHATGARIRE